MKHSSINIELRNAFLMSVLLGIYFLLLVILNWADNVYFKFGNILIVGLAVYHTQKEQLKQKHSNYLTQFFSGVRTAIFGTIFSIVGLWTFITIFPESYSEFAGASILPVRSLAEFISGIAIEGISGAVVISLVLMQYWKNFEFKKYIGIVERPQ